MKHTEPPPIPHHHTPEELHHEDVAHEHSDVDVRAILMFGGAMVVVSVVSAVVIYFLFWGFERIAEANDPKQSPLAMPSTDMPRHTTESPYFGAAPQPQLITNEPAVLRQLRQSEAEQLHDYGWVDQATGIARMPIEEAKKRILERGVPVRAGGAIDPWVGTHAPAFGESSSGRTIPTGEASAPAGSKEPPRSKDPGATKQEPR